MKVVLVAKVTIFKPKFKDAEVVFGNKPILFTVQYGSWLWLSVHNMNETEKRLKQKEIGKK